MIRKTADGGFRHDATGKDFEVHVLDSDAKEVSKTAPETRLVEGGYVACDGETGADDRFSRCARQDGWWCGLMGGALACVVVGSWWVCTQEEVGHMHLGRGAADGIDEVLR